MAVIDFKCKQCGQTFFKIVGSDEERKSVVCPGCGSGDIKQVFGGTAYITSGNRSAGGGCCSGSCGGCSGCGH